MTEHNVLYIHFFLILLLLTKMKFKKTLQIYIIKLKGSTSQSPCHQPSPTLCSTQVLLKLVQHPQLMFFEGLHFNIIQ